MAITSIPDQKTPARPVEITFAGDTGTPSANQEVTLIGHALAGTPASGLYTPRVISNSGDQAAAKTEAEAKFGVGSELSKMVVAAVKANLATGRFVQLTAIALASTDTDFGAANAALTAVDRIKAEYVVSPYDGQSAGNRNLLKAQIAAMSSAQRPSNNQFGSFGVVFNRSVTDPSTLFKFDTQFLIGLWLPDTSDGSNVNYPAPTYSIGEEAAAAAAMMAGNGSPFNPLDDVTIGEIDAPSNQKDWITVGAALQSEVALNQGWTPLRVKPNGEVAFVRTVSGRVSADGSGTPVVTSYYDVQDFNVLYFWRKTVYTRLSQPDFKQRKASAATANEIKAELIRLAAIFEDQQMFQAVSQLAKQFVVQRSTSDRSRFDVLTPVNVIPGLHVIATNVVATTQFDTLTV